MRARKKFASSLFCSLGSHDFYWKGNRMRWVSLHRKFEKIAREFLSLIKEDVGDDFPDNLLVDGFYKYLWEVQENQVFKEAKEEMEKVDVIKHHLNNSVGVAGNAYASLPHKVIFGFLYGLLKTNDNCKFNKKRFDRVYVQFESFFMNGTIPFRCFAFLFGFGMDAQKFIFQSPKITIREMNQDDFLFFKTNYHGLSWCRYMVEFKGEFKKIIGKPEDFKDVTRGPGGSAKKTFDAFVSALRLQHKGYVSNGGVWTTPTVWVPSISTHEVFEPNYPISLVEYYYEPKQRTNTLKCYSSLTNFDYKKNKAFAMALRRFNYGYEKKRSDEQLIDYVISLESLLLKGSKQELGYKLALRGAYAIGRNATQRRLYFDLLKGAYDVRSGLVHGGSIKKHIKIGSQKFSLKQLVEETEDIIREVILYFMYRLGSDSHEDIISDLHEKSLL